MLEDKDVVTVVVNAREKVIPVVDLSPDGELSFAQIVHLAYDPVPTGQDIVFTVSYREGAGRPDSGRLVDGQSTKVKNGTVFNVSFTDRS